MYFLNLTKAMTDQEIAINEERTNFIWHPLDNAAKIYPAIISEKTPAVFRITVVLKSPVRIKSLIMAVSALNDRFPYFKVKLKKGAFWYYLEHVNFPIHVELDKNDIPCRKFPIHKLWFRILVRENRISVEFSHILTDGAGALSFLKTVLIQYLSTSNKTSTDDSHHPVQKVDPEEFEDAFIRYFKEGLPPMIRKPKAFHLDHQVNPDQTFAVLQAHISKTEIKQKAKENGVSITVFLVSVYLFALQEIFESQSSIKKKKANKHLRIQVPVDLRNIYPTRTMRNFSLFLMPEIDLRLGHYDFKEILKTVHHQVLLGKDQKLISKIISRNVGSEKKFYIRGIPLYIKSLILRTKYNSLGPSQYSGVITNLGGVQLPTGMDKYVDHFIFVPPPPHKKIQVSCGVIGYKDKIVMSFGNVTATKLLEQYILRFITKLGISVKLTVN
jgi:NRPS condensation-like uncharacterized protein